MSKQRSNKLPLLSKLYIGIDNGVTGSIGWTNGNGVFGQIPTPTFSQLSYTKKKKNITRINSQVLFDTMNTLVNLGTPLFASIERPMINPTRFAASMSAMRALECTQTILDWLQIPYQFVDSKEWQGMLLPKGITGPSERKKAGIDVAKRLYPSLTCTPDADGILIAEASRRLRL